MEHYDRRMVFAPEWMEHFACLAGDCPEVCCQQWNVDVDPGHAESLRHIDDPELQELMNRILRTVRIRRPGSRQTDTIHRLQLLNQPDRRCPLLNERNECRLQKKYGPYVLCDTCYFHPRTFWQINEQTCLSACLSCSECARLALMHEEPTRFSRFEAEIDPTAEWLETELIRDPGARQLLEEREQRIRSLCGLLQDRSFPVPQRVLNAVRSLLADAGDHSAETNGPAPLDAAEMMSLFAEVFDPDSGALEKPARGAEDFLHALAGGRDGYFALLASNYQRGKAICEPFIAGRPWLEENFLVHYVFSDSFRQFYRYQNDEMSAGKILRHEAALLTVWFWFLRVLMCQAALAHGEMNEALFLAAVIRADKVWWHYPDWFARCADQLQSVLPEGLPRLLVSL